MTRSQMRQKHIYKNQQMTMHLTQLISQKPQPKATRPRGNKNKGVLLGILDGLQNTVLNLIAHLLYSLRQIYLDALKASSGLLPPPPISTFSLSDAEL